MGLDKYKIRTWGRLDHHIAMCLLAEAILAEPATALGEKMPPGHSTPGL